MTSATLKAASNNAIETKAGDNAARAPAPAAKAAAIAPAASTTTEAMAGKPARIARAADQRANDRQHKRIDWRLEK